MSFDTDKIGLFRANPEANVENALKLTPPTGTGTPQVDTGTIDVSVATSIEGVRYTGKDGVSALIQFFNEDHLTQKRTPYVLSAQAEPEVIQAAIHKIISLHEIDSIVSVTKAVNTLTVSHTGSGSLTAVVVDGADSALTRANIALAGIAVAEPVKVSIKKK